MPAAAEKSLAKAVLWMVGSLLSFCAVALSVRALQNALTVFEILILRNIGGLAILGAMVVVSPEPGQRLAMTRPGVHLLRNSVHFVGQALWAYGVMVLPLATVFAIEFTTPAWVALFAVLFLKEAMTPWRALALVLGLLGVLVILRPGLESFRPEALAVGAAAICFGAQLTITKFLTGSNSTWTILIWMNLMQWPLNMAANLAIGGEAWFFGKLGAEHWRPVIGICVCGLTAHYCLTNAFRHGDAMVVVPIDFLRVPLIGLVGWLLYAETPDPAVFAGAAVIFAGVLVSIYQESRTRA